MKLSEVSLGDWVNDIDFGPGEILCINPNGVVLWLKTPYDGKPTSSVAFEGIEPIKITTEILESIGWQPCVGSIKVVDLARVPEEDRSVWAPGHPSNIRLKNEGIHGWTLTTPVFGKSPKEVNTIHQIFNLHELQHSLRDCGYYDEAEFYETAGME